MRLVGGRPRVLGIRIDPVDYAQAVQRALQSARAGRGGYICAANVHMAMEARDDRNYRQILENALLVVPDGMPLVWALRFQGYRLPDRVYGPTLALHICRMAADQGIPIGLYGGRPVSLHPLTEQLTRWCPGLRITYAWAPPFRSLTPEEDRDQVEAIRKSGTGILLVGLGCPKQERWMADHATTLPCLMVGVGAFFDFCSGRVRQAPSTLQRLGLEWTFRLAMEPRRLWMRYLKHNPRFLFLLIRQVAGLGIGAGRDNDHC